MRIKTVLVLISILALMACSKPGDQKMFEFSGGELSSLSDYKGQWLLINYWAIWCKPCVEEIPELNKVGQRSDMTVIGYNFDRLSGEELANQAGKLDIRFPLVNHDPASLFGLESPSALPATMVIDPEGMFKMWLLGPQTVETITARIFPES